MIDVNQACNLASAARARLWEEEQEQIKTRDVSWWVKWVIMRAIEKGENSVRFRYMSKVNRAILENNGYLVQIFSNNEITVCWQPKSPLSDAIKMAKDINHMFRGE